VDDAVAVVGAGESGGGDGEEDESAEKGTEAHRQ
jgi:hypothetical protein